MIRPSVSLLKPGRAAYMAADTIRKNTLAPTSVPSKRMRFTKRKERLALQAL